MRLSTDWLDQILTKPADESWKDIFSHLNALASAQESEIKTRYCLQNVGKNIAKDQGDGRRIQESVRANEPFR